MDHITLIIAAAMAVYALYQLINIMRSEPVEATLTGFEESSHWDTNTDTEVQDIFPVYRYQHNGWQKTYRSGIGAALPFLKKKTHRIYIRKDGKVFEKESAIFGAIAAAILFLIGI